MVTRPIVVGVDGSEESLQAVEWAAQEAGRHSWPLRIVSAPATVPPIRAYHAAADTVAAALRGISERALEVAVSRSRDMAPGVRVSTGLLAGSAALAVADSGADAAMLVVGARGAGGFTAMILGSVSRYAATHAVCPVVVVRQENMAIHREIAVGIRDPAAADGALAFAFAEAAERGAGLVAVHAWHWFPAALRRAGVGAGAPGLASDPVQISAEADRALAAALNQWRDKYPWMRVRTDVIRGHPGRVLASYSVRADLVVLGRHSGFGQAGPGTLDSVNPGVGTTLHAVLDHAHGPVAVVPEGAR